MGYPRKIATCCYCGTRAALVLEEAGRHELKCSACGAPLHALKSFPVRRAPEPEQRQAVAPRKAKAGRAVWDGKKKKRKKRKPVWGKLVEEAFDFLEDLID